MTIERTGDRGINLVSNGGDEEEDIQLLSSEIITLTDSDRNATDLVDAVHLCAMDELIPSQRLGEAIRFFVDLPGASSWNSAVGFVNQGNTTLLECRAQAVHIFSMCDSAVDVIYNPAVGAWSSRHISSESESVRLLKRSWDDYFNHVNCSGALRLQFCAGDGTFIVRAALQNYEHASRIFVVALAPSCRVDPGACFRVRHYRSSLDLTSLGRGPGSRFPESAVVRRSDHSRGTFDFCVSSSSFMEFLRLEGLCFNLRQVLVELGQLPVNYDDKVQSLRERYLEDGGVIGNRYSRFVISEEQRGSRQRHDLSHFLSRYGGIGVVTSMNNLYESALDEYPRDLVERVVSSINLCRDLILIPAAIAVVIRTRSGYTIPNVIWGTPLLHALNTVRSAGVYLIRRDQEEPSAWRSLALQGCLFEVICCLYDMGMIGVLVASPETPNFMIVGLGGYALVMGSNLLTQNMVRFFSPLRGRVQRSLTMVGDENIATERTENEVAARVGLVERVFRSITQIGTGTATLVAAASLLYPILAPTMFSESGSSTVGGVNTSSSSQGFPSSNIDTASAILVGITGVVSVASFIGNICQIRRLVRVLRRDRVSPRPPSPGFIEAIPLDPEAGLRRAYRNGPPQEEEMTRVEEED